MGSKGGIGKSLIAYFIAQYIMEKKGTIVAFDTDLHNKTFASYPAINAQPLDMLDPVTKAIKPASLDLILEATDETEADVVIDIGASSYQPFAKYQQEMDLYGTWVDMGHQVLIHAVLAGGKSYEETLETFDETMKSTAFGKSIKAIAWFNHVNGPLEKDGVAIEDSEIFTKHTKKLSGLAPLPVIEDLFAQVLIKVITECLILAEVEDSSKFMKAEKIRAQRIKKAIYELLDSQNIIL